MEKEKKQWFLALGYRLWVPISWEGWAVMIFFVGVLLLIRQVNMALFGNGAFEFSKHWPMMLELGVTIFAIYWVTRGRVKKQQ